MQIGYKIIIENTQHPYFSYKSYILKLSDDSIVKEDLLFGHSIIETSSYYLNNFHKIVVIPVIQCNIDCVITKQYIEHYVLFYDDAETLYNQILSYMFDKAGVAIII